MYEAKLNKAVVLDRDGTMVVDRRYLHHRKGLTSLPGADYGIHWFRDNGYRLVVITNRSGTGRGIFSLRQLRAINLQFQEIPDRTGVRLTQIYDCPHTPESNCACRKPRTGLLLRAATELYFDPADAIVIRESGTDMETGHRLGATTILISSQLEDAHEYSRPVFITRNLC
jgi:histidinol-phosphate phosphatase family protein